MKLKLYLLFISGILSCYTTTAQIKKGSVLLGGSVGVNFSKADAVPEYYWDYETKQTKLNFSPSVGIAFKDNWILGVGLVLETTTEKYKDAYPGKFKEHSVGFDLFVRRYWEVAKKFYVFGEGKLGTRFKEDGFKPYGGDSDLTNRSVTISASLNPGLSYAINNKIHLESTFLTLLSANYNQSWVKHPSFSGKGLKRTDFDLSGTFDNQTDFTIGARIFLSK